MLKLEVTINMQTKRVSNEMLKNIKGYETREAYVSPYDSLTKIEK